MTTATTSSWEKQQSDETKGVEKLLQEKGFQRVDAYRYNSASIRVRVVDGRFENLPPDQRDALVEPVLDELPESTQADIMVLLTFAPSELLENGKLSRAKMLNAEFEDPSPSML